MLQQIIKSGDLLIQFVSSHIVYVAWSRLLKLRLASFGADGGQGLPHLALGGHLVYRSYKRKADVSFTPERCLLYSRAMSS